MAWTPEQETAVRTLVGLCASSDKEIQLEAAKTLLFADRDMALLGITDAAAREADPNPEDDPETARPGQWETE